GGASDGVHLETEETVQLSGCTVRDNRGSGVRRPAFRIRGCDEGNLPVTCDRKVPFIAERSLRHDPPCHCVIRELTCVLH
ncbi:hypothetical protein ABZ805_22565, partial [Saccharopolyspora sp. NPDC047091]|uniref:hypothetical protein n=1 Tax=Saccharopolyspora sp. NPDC047091 TaxID=3155924 RepID=UPI0033F83F0E